jgi:hypothetical protein
MLRHTEADIETVGKFDMEPGNIYIIQHNKEGLKSINPYDKNITREEIDDYYTRFRGKFVKYDIGKSSRYPDGIPGISNREVAVFENVEIISKNKSDLTDDIYVIFTDPREGRQHITKGVSWVDVSVADNTANRDDETKHKKAIKQMLLGIRRNYKVAFAVNAWTFADSAADVQKDIESRTIGHLVNDESKNKLQDQVFRSGPLGPAGIIDAYVGTDVLKKDEEQTVGTKRKFDEVGGRKRTRRNKKRKGRTRKGKSRKGKTMKRRYHYRND